MKSLARLSLLFVVLMLLFPAAAFADGKAFIVRDHDYLRPALETEQVAAISHSDGIEKMIIAVNFEAEDSDSAVWIFPVPGTPSEIKVDVVDSFPEFRGYDPRSQAAETLASAAFLARAPLLFPFCLEAVLLPALGRSGAKAEVHEELDKWGIHIETVTANSLESLTAYLKEKKAGIPQEELRTFEPYLSDEYVLVITWVASRKEMQKEFEEFEQEWYSLDVRRPCVYVEFPTEKAFFPLRPTSGYEGETIPVRLYVTGYVKPETGADLSKYTEVSHYLGSGFRNNTPVKFRAGLSTAQVPYTKISISAPSEHFTDDLWFSPIWAPRLKLAEFMIGMERHYDDTKIPYCLYFLFVALLSYVSAGLSGLIVFGKWRGYAKLGLWNVLTIIGFGIAVNFIRGEGKDRISAEDSEGTKRNFLYLFITIYLALTMVLEVVLPGLFGLRYALIGSGLSIFTFLIVLIFIAGIFFAPKKKEHLETKEQVRRAARIFIYAILAGVIIVPIIFFLPYFVGDNHVVRSVSRAESLYQTSDGGYVFVGQGGRQIDLWLVKVDVDGKEQWNRTFGGTGFDEGKDIQQTADGGYIIAGETSFGGGKGSIRLIKTDPEGRKEWEKIIAARGEFEAINVICAHDGEYIIGGTKGRNDGILLIKTNAKGRELWRKQYGKDWHAGSCAQVLQTNDGGYVLLGDYTDYEAHRDYSLLIKTDSDGNEKWRSSFRRHRWGESIALQQTNDCGYIILGHMQLIPYLIKTNALGEKEWYRSMGPMGWRPGRSIYQADDGGFILGNRAHLVEGDSGVVFLIKTDSKGREEWSRSFEDIAEGTGPIIQPTRDGGFIILGETLKDGDSITCMIKTDAKGNKQWERTFAGKEVTKAHDGNS